MCNTCREISSTNTSIHRTINLLSTEMDKQILNFRRHFHEPTGDSCAVSVEASDPGCSSYYYPVVLRPLLPNYVDRD